MATTKNFGLTMPDDGKEYFEDWWKNMSLGDTSNMEKIDQILGGMAATSETLHITLLATAWLGEAAPFTQVVGIESLEEEQNGVATMSPTATEGERACMRDALLSVSGQSNGSLVFLADGEKPTVDLPICVVYLG